MIPIYVSVYDYQSALDVLETHKNIEGLILRQSLLSTSEEIDNIIHNLLPLANQAGIKLYIKDNRLLHNMHLKTVTQTLSQLNTHNIGVFIGDPAIFTITNKISYDGDVIFAPEMILTSHQNAQFWIDQGATNVEISHELTFKELNVIIQNLKHRPFVQIHGQLSMFQSRRLLVNNYLTHLDLNENIHTHPGELALYDKERELHYIITQDERGTEIYNGQSISIIDLLNRFEIRPNCIVDTYFLTKQKREDVINLYIEAFQDEAYDANKEIYANKMQLIYADEPLSRGFFLKPTIF